MKKIVDIEVKDINLIIEISNKLSRIHDIELLKDAIVKEIVKMTKCDGGAILLYNDTDFIEIDSSFNIDNTYRGILYDCLKKYMSEIFFGDIINVLDINERGEIKKILKENAVDPDDCSIKSVLTIPFVNVNNNNRHFALFLYNARNNAGEILSFEKKYEYLIYIIIFQAMVSLYNINQIFSIKMVLNSMVEAFTAAIDERTPYNANHSKNMARYINMLIEYINKQHEYGKCKHYFSVNDKEQLIMAVFLHDIGKLVIPLSIMNKSTRLGKDGIEKIEIRYQLIRANLKIDLLSKRINHDTWEKENLFIDESLEFIKTVDIILELEEEMLLRIEKLFKRKYITIDNDIIDYLNCNEKTNLSIKTGTLSANDREIMEKHVLITERLLTKIDFSKEYDKVKEIAVKHHEFLDGSGYPRGLHDEEIPFESQMITVVDIFDSLISDDRPYKNSVSFKRAFEVLYDMADNGKISKEIVEMFYHMMVENREEQ